MNKLKKNSVAFGLSILVKNPIFTAENGFISDSFVSFPTFIFEDFEKKAFRPIYIRYAAPKYLIILKIRMDFEMIKARPARE